MDDLAVAQQRSMEPQLVSAPLQMEREISSDRRRDGGYRQMARTTLPFPPDGSRRSSSGAAGRAKYSASRLMLAGSKEHIGMCLKTRCSNQQTRFHDSKAALKLQSSTALLGTLWRWRCLGKRHFSYQLPRSPKTSMTRANLLQPFSQLIESALSNRSGSPFKSAAIISSCSATETWSSLMIELA